MYNMYTVAFNILLFVYRYKITRISVVDKWTTSAAQRRRNTTRIPAP